MKFRTLQVVITSSKLYTLFIDLIHDELLANTIGLHSTPPVISTSLPVSLLQSRLSTTSSFADLAATPFPLSSARDSQDTVLQRTSLHYFLLLLRDLRNPSEFPHIIDSSLQSHIFMTSEATFPLPYLKPSFLHPHQIALGPLFFQTPSDCHSCAIDKGCQTSGVLSPQA